MDRDEKVFRLVDTILSAGPELGILGLFAFVQYSNFATGSTTTNAGPGPNPIIGQKGSGSSGSSSSGITPTGQLPP